MLLVLKPQLYTRIPISKKPCLLDKISKHMAGFSSSKGGIEMIPIVEKKVNKAQTDL
jgi:hypothetical protein